MPVDHQPTFNRTSLNILILVCIVLILIFGQSMNEEDDTPMPPVPKLDISIWKTDSGAQVWFSPKLDKNIYIQLHYRAGFGFNQQDIPAGTSHLLVSLLNHQARKQGLPFKASLSPDFIEVALILSNDPLLMRQQLNAILSLLYRPDLPNEILNEAKLILPSHLDELWADAYSNHPYAGPKHGNDKSLSTIHRAGLQKFQQQFLHPQRLFASISGNINEHAAQVIMESLLPESRFSASHTAIKKFHPLGSKQQGSIGLIVLPASDENVEDLANILLMLEVLKLLQPTQMQLVFGSVNNSLLIEQWPSLISTMDTSLDSDMMRQAKRQTAKVALERTQTAQALSEYLVWLNRHHLPSNFLHKQFSVIEHWQEKDWDHLKTHWLLLPQIE